MMIHSSPSIAPLALLLFGASVLGLVDCESIKDEGIQ